MFVPLAATNRPRRTAKAIEMVITLGCMTCLAFSAPAQTAPTDAAPKATTRAALTAACGSPEAKDLVALLETQLAGASGVTLVERAEIARLVQE